MREPFSIPLLALLVAGSNGCSTAPETSGRGQSTEWAVDVNAQLGSRAIRRLSKRELRNTYRALTGLDPKALDRMPPDDLGYTFDRVVDAQTVSPAHLNAAAAAAEEAARSLLAGGTLGRLAGSCGAAILPPLEPATTVRIIGASLAVRASLATEPNPSDPTRITSTKFGDPTASYTHRFAASGLYEGTLKLQVGERAIDTLDVLANGAVIYSTGKLEGAAAAKFPISVEAPGDVVLRFEFKTVPLDNSLTFDYVGLDIEGPLDHGAKAEARRACATELVDRFAPLAYRRPLTPEQRQGLLQAYDSGVVTAGPGAGLQALLQAIFTSPHFLYLVDRGTPVPERPDLYRLSSWEVAERLSYSSCEQPPDEALRRAAEQSELQNVAQVETQARRLLESPCGHQTVANFFNQWLGLDRLPQLSKDARVFPEFTPAVREGMKAETDRFIGEMVWTRDASLSELLTSRAVWPDPRSAFLYGWEGVTATAQSTVPTNRAGLLMHPGVLAVNSGFGETSPIKRGVYVLQRILCAELPRPADVPVPPMNPGLTARQRMAEHSSNPACRACHELIDPVGSLLEGFDAIGRYREGVDTTGGAVTLGYAMGTLNGGIDLVEALAASDRTTACFSRQWLRFALGRNADDGDAADLSEVETALRRGSIREALIRLLASPSLLYRRERGTR